MRNQVFFCYRGDRPKGRVGLCPSIPSSGFTLVELVVVLVIIGVLAVAAVPRFFDRKTYDTRGFLDQAMATMRYAQKAAIAGRTRVLVTVDAGGISACLTTPGSCTAANGGCVAPALVGPNGVDLSAADAVPVPPGVAISPATSFTFDGLGCASAGNTFTVTGDGASSFTVEAGTGYVH